MVVYLSPVDKAKQAETSLLAYVGHARICVDVGNYSEHTLLANPHVTRQFILFCCSLICPRYKKHCILKESLLIVMPKHLSQRTGSLTSFSKTGFLDPPVNEVYMSHA